MNAVMTAVIRIAVLVVAASLVVASCSSREENQTPAERSTVFEGARLITGDGSRPVENSAFVVSGGTFTAVGRRDALPIPAGAARVDLTGKTVMPAHTV